MNKEKVKDLIQEMREELDYINRSSDDAKDLLVELEEEMDKWDRKNDRTTRRENI